MAAPQHVSTATLPELVWVRPPQQARSQLTLSRILDAAEAILAEKSGRTPGLPRSRAARALRWARFYSRFPDKDALLVALHQRFIEEAFATSQAALDETRWAGASICEIVRELRCVPGARERPAPRTAARVRPARAIHDPSFHARGERLERAMEERFTKLVVARRHEILHPMPVVAASFVGRMISAMLLSRLLDPKFVRTGMLVRGRADSRGARLPRACSPRTRSTSCRPRRVAVSAGAARDATRAQRKLPGMSRPCARAITRAAALVPAPLALRRRAGCRRSESARVSPRRWPGRPHRSTAASTRALPRADRGDRGAPLRRRARSATTDWKRPVEGAARAAQRDRLPRHLAVARETSRRLFFFSAQVDADLGAETQLGRARGHARGLGEDPRGPVHERGLVPRLAPGRRPAVAARESARGATPAALAPGAVE